MCLSTFRYEGHLPFITMADVRSLLREQRTLRRINHPHAVYSKTGTLSCAVCHIPIKSEVLWDGHLKSSAHIARARQPDDAAAIAPVESKKRKATENEEHTDHTKRSKPTQPSTGLSQALFDESAALEAPDKAESSKSPTQRPSTETTPYPRDPSSAAPPPSSNLPSDFFDSSSKAVATTVPGQVAADAIATETETVDEDEYAAFEREIAAAAATASNATITVAPVSAAELAARAIAEASAQKGQADVEIEGEEEDAVRRMEVEIDEMEVLEERAKRLRDRREELRKRQEGVGETVMGNGEAEANLQPEGVNPEEQDDEEEDDDDDLDDWTFRPA